MRIALLYNGRPTDAPVDGPDDAFEEYDSRATVDAIAQALLGVATAVEPVPADALLPWRLREGKFDLAFNIAEGEVGWRRNREAIPAAVCELLSLRYTHSDPLTLAVTLDKAVARRAVSPEVPVARGLLVGADGQPVDGRLEDLAYPVLVKPDDEGSSKGIRGGPVADTPDEARAKVVRLVEEYGCPVLVEEFLPGAEVTVGVAGNAEGARVLGALHVTPVEPDERFVYSLEVKRDWRRQVRYHVPPELPAATQAELERLALLAYRLLGCRDLARVDFRLDAAGQPRFLECNPLPGLNPESGDIVLLSRPTLSYEALVQGVVNDALSRLERPRR